LGGSSDDEEGLDLLDGGSSDDDQGRDLMGGGSGSDASASEDDDEGEEALLPSECKSRKLESKRRARPPLPALPPFFFHSQLGCSLVCGPGPYAVER